MVFNESSILIRMNLPSFDDVLYYMIVKHHTSSLNLNVFSVKCIC